MEKDVNGQTRRRGDGKEGRKKSFANRELGVEANLRIIASDLAPLPEAPGIAVAKLQTNPLPKSKIVGSGG